MNRLKNGSLLIGVSVLIAALLFAFVPAGRVVAAPPEGGNRPLVLTLDGLADILSRLEERLCSLQARPGERFDKQLDQLIGLIEDLLDQEGLPFDEEGGLPVKARIVRIDLRLHRLVYILDEIVEDAADTPARPAAREAMDDLRNWLDGYIEGATAEMSPAEADRFEEAARAMIRALAGEVLGIVRRAETQDRPTLERLVERLEDLLFRLDGFILRNSPPPSPNP